MLQLLRSSTAPELVTQVTGLAPEHPLFGAVVAEVLRAQQ